MNTERKITVAGQCFEIWELFCDPYRIPYSQGFRGPIFSRIANGSEFREKYFRD